jgi:tRNA uridine 5-carboxymethylaminomethyl modification enzyme
MNYDIIVVGGGHAGCEAAHATSKIGLTTLLISGDLNQLAKLPCNPSIGGPAKGIVVREIDALGGIQGKIADLTQIQTKMLNSSKGPAVQALRVQSDKIEYPKEMRKALEKMEKLSLLEALVDEVLIEDGKAIGVKLSDDTKIYAKAVILTTGTYLNSKTLRGHDFKIEGPDGEPTTYGLSAQLKRLGFDVTRLKTGTPPRIKKDSIDYSKVSLEPGDDIVTNFSFDGNIENLSGVEVPCYLTYTNLEIHDIIMNNLDASAMYGGVIEGVGPRYCPSIETKVVRFNDKERHQIFIEPESLALDEIYLGGFSTSMPIEIQDKMIRLIPGLEDAVVTKYAYAIEYDAINPINLWPTLETKLIKNLYCAGQINSTSGYEEAAAQGLMAGINACLKISDMEPFILQRHEAYIGVLIDDLVTKGTSEPYRLLTSRAEYRLLLRHDNADLRLREYGYKVGLITDMQHDAILKKKEDISNCIEMFKGFKVSPTKELNAALANINSSVLNNGTTLFDLIKRPEVTASFIKENFDFDYPLYIVKQVEIEIKYEGYIKKAFKEAEKLISNELRKIPADIDYDNIPNIALEAREKLKEIRPLTIGQASRISGVNPADIAILSVYIKGGAR